MSSNTQTRPGPVTVSTGTVGHPQVRRDAPQGPDPVPHHRGRRREEALGLGVERRRVDGPATQRAHRDGQLRGFEGVPPQPQQPGRGPVDLDHAAARGGEDDGLVERGHHGAQAARGLLRLHLGVEQGCEQGEAVEGSGPSCPTTSSGSARLRPEQHDARHRVRQGRDEGSGQRRRERRPARQAAPGRAAESGSRASSGATCAPSRAPAAPQASPTTHGGHQGRRRDDARAGRGEPHEHTRIGPELVDDATQRGKHLRCHSAPSTCVALGPDAPTASGRPLRRAADDATVAPHPRAPPPLGVNGGVSRVTPLRRSTPRPVPHPYCVPMGEAPGEDSRFESAMRHSAIGMSLVAPDGTFLEVNAALCTMLGRDEAELRATTWQELTHPDDLAVDAALVQEVVDGLRDSYRLAKRYLRPDGTVVHGDLSVVGMRGADGAVRVPHLPGRRHDRPGAAARPATGLLAENATDVVALADNDGVVQWISDAVTRVIGWAPSDMEGRPWADFVHPDDQPLMRENQVRLRAGRVGRDGAAGAGEATAPTAGRASGCSPVADEDGQPSSGGSRRGGTPRTTHQAREACAAPRRSSAPRSTRRPTSHIFMDAVRDDAGGIVDFVLVDANQATFDFFAARPRGHGRQPR